MSYIAQGFGVFLGVIAGVLVTSLASWVAQLAKQKKQKQNLKFELKINIQNIDRWLEELTKYRNAVNGDDLGSYFGYFDLSKVLYVTANNMFQAGLLYKYLDHEEIRHLQEIFSQLSPAGEKVLNEQVTYHKQNCGQQELWAQAGKKNAVQHVTFWEEKLKTFRKALLSIIDSLG